MKKIIAAAGVAFLLMNVGSQASGSHTILTTCSGVTATWYDDDDVWHAYGLGSTFVDGDGVPDVVQMNMGDDLVGDTGGADRICGHDGNDHVEAGPGNDHIFGGDGDDNLYGQGGSGDTINGGPGYDECYGGETYVNCEVTN